MSSFHNSDFNVVRELQQSFLLVRPFQALSLIDYLQYVLFDFPLPLIVQPGDCTPRHDMTNDSFFGADHVMRKDVTNGRLEVLVV